MAYRAPEGNSGSEQVTGRRFSLANPEIGSRDIFINHPAGKHRLVVYEDVAFAHSALREKLLNERVMLGVPIDTAEPDVVAVEIPSSSRPVKYDSLNQTKGQYSYDDDRLLFDIGELVGVLRMHGLFIDGSVSDCLALDEFTDEADRRVFLMPGAEMIVKIIPPQLDPLTYYEEHFNETVGHQFSEAQTYFRMGYVQSLLQGLTDAE
jgi:hypothetical protein